MMRRVLPVLSVVLIAGCGASPQDTASAPVAAAPADPQPCDLLSAMDVKLAMGEDVAGGETAGFECMYRRPPNEKNLRTTAAQVRLEIALGPPKDVIDRYATRMRDALGAYDLSYEPVEPGRLVAWDGDAMVAATPVSPTRTAFVIVQLSGTDESQQRRIARMLADQALTKVNTRGK